MISPYVYPGLAKIADPTPKDIIEAICTHYRIDEAKVYARTRKENVVMARQAIIFTLVKLTGMTFMAAGKKLFRDHSTAIHSCTRFEGIVRTNDNDRNLYYRALMSVSPALWARFDVEYPIISMKYKRLGEMPKKELASDFGEKVFFGEISQSK